MHPLRELHVLLYPERYGYNPGHPYWADFDPDTQTEREYKIQSGVYQWDSDTIEWVAEDIDRLAEKHGVSLNEYDPSIELFI